MNIVAISDTHGKHNQLDMCNYDKDSTLLIAGDITSNGSSAELFTFLEWVEALNFKHKILVVGNHDKSVEKYPTDFTALLATFPSVTYLENSGATIEGVNFWGSPDTPTFGTDWAFNRSHEELVKTWSKVPANTDVLICHGPPHKILDKVNNNWSPTPNVGDPVLRDMVLKSTIAHCVFGHIHEEGGKSLTVEDTEFHNVAVLNERYRVTNKPTEFTVHIKGQ